MSWSSNKTCAFLIMEHNSYKITLFCKIRGCLNHENIKFFPRPVIFPKILKDSVRTMLCLRRSCQILTDNPRGLNYGDIPNWPFVLHGSGIVVQWLGESLAGRFEVIRSEVTTSATETNTEWRLVQCLLYRNAYWKIDLPESELLIKIAKLQVNAKNCTASVSII